MSYIPRLPRTVYILGDGLLFVEIIAHMLSSDPNMRVINRIYGNRASFLTDLSSYRPDVILLNETYQFSHERVLALLSQVSLAADLRVIAVSLDNNKIHVYDQPADQASMRVGPYTLTDISNWHELFDLVAGKDLIGIEGNNSCRNGRTYAGLHGGS